jgi:hypothetical protein
VGDGLALLGLTIIMLKHRARTRSFWFLAALFFSVAVFLLLSLAAWSTVPYVDRSPDYKLRALVGLVVLALGTWPACLHFTFGLWLNGHPALTDPVKLGAKE